MKRIFLLNLLLYFGFLDSSAPAQTITVQSDADAQLGINDACPWQTTNYGAAQYCPANTWTWYGPGCGEGSMRSLLHFDLNGISGPQQLYDNRATLCLYYPTGSTETHFYTGSGTDNQFYIQRVTASWSEMVVTWDTQPAATTTGQVLVPSAPTNPSTQDYFIDVSTLIPDWICNTVPNYGILMKLVNEGQTYRRVTFTSREYTADTSRRPAVALEYAYIAASGPDTICLGNTFNLLCSLTNAYDTSVYQFQWTHLNTSTTYGSRNVVNPVHVSGLNTYVVTVTNPWCQTGMDTVEVFVTLHPNAAAGYNTPLCEGETLQLNSSGGLSYQWSGPGGFTSGLQNPVISNATPANAGAYTVIVSNGTGCDTTIVINVSVNPWPAVTVSAAADTICSGSNTQLTASGASGYEWSNSATGASVTVTPATSTTYTVTGTSSAGCEASASINIIVNPDPLVSIAGEDSVCAGSPALLTAAGASTYSWSTGANTTFITVAPIISGTYSVTGTNAYGCEGTASFIVNVLALPIPSISPIAETCTGAADGILLVTVTGGQPPYSYIWSNGQNGDSIMNVGEGSYSVTATNGNGCAAAESINVDSSPEPCYIPGIYIPNVFSPNGDGHNDVLYVRGQGVETMFFVIFDRWGQKVFESEALDSGWDGSKNGKKYDEGVFMYYFKATMMGGDKKVMKGSISLIR